MPHTQLPEFEIGELLNLPPGFADRIASVAYDLLRPIAITHPQGSAMPASQMLEALALQLLRLHAENGVKLAMFEPLPSAQFGLLKRLFARTGPAYGKQLVGDPAYHEHLDHLTQLAHQRFALLANLDVADLGAYNAHPRTRRKEAWQLLLVSAVLPQSGRDGDLAALQHLCIEGPKVGIVPLLLRGPAEELEQENTYTRKPLQAFWSTVAPLCFGFDWHQQPPAPVNQLDVYWRSLNRFGVRVGVPALHAQQWVDELCAAQVQIAKEAEYPDFLSVPIGDEGNEPVHFCFGSASSIHNALLGGKVESGKTTIVHNVLLGACEALPPEQLRLWIIDPSGLGFRVYQDLPHTEFLHSALVPDPKALEPRLLTALDIFEAQWATRAQAMSDAGVDNINDYNALPGKCLPRCLLVVDEAHNIMANRRAAALLGKIAREGRKFGFHMILLTPSFQELPFDNNVKGQIGLRIGCKVDDESTSRNLFGHDNAAAAHLPISDGIRMAVVNAKGGHPGGNRVVHLYKLDSATRLARIRALVRRYPHYPPPIEPAPPSPPPTATRSAWQPKPGEFDPGNLV